METTPRRVSLITGGTEGIGRAVALALARGGDRVLFVGRDAARGREVLAELERSAPGGDHAFLPADLSLVGDTARVAEEVAARSERLDAIVCCAGILSTIPELTAEGLERTFVLNYLSRYVLARRLLPRLTAAPSGRLVLVANAGRYKDTLDLDDLQHRRGKRGLAVSGRTQFANDLLALELAERLEGTRVDVTCVFPGVARTRVFRNARGLPWMLRALIPLVSLFALPVEVAAQTPVFLARDDAARGANGRFYGPRKKELAVPPRACVPERRRALWDASAALVSAYV